MVLRLAGPIDDVMLYSYLINPTHTMHRLGDVAARFTTRALPGPGDELLPGIGARHPDPRTAAQGGRRIAGYHHPGVSRHRFAAGSRFCWA